MKRWSRARSYSTRLTRSRPGQNSFGWAEARSTPRTLSSASRSAQAWRSSPTRPSSIALPRDLSSRSTASGPSLSRRMPATLTSRSADSSPAAPARRSRPEAELLGHRRRRAVVRFFLEEAVLAFQPADHLLQAVRVAPVQVDATGVRPLVGFEVTRVLGRQPPQVLLLGGRAQEEDVHEHLLHARGRDLAEEAVDARLVVGEAGRIGARSSPASIPASWSRLITSMRTAGGGAHGSS